MKHGAEQGSRFAPPRSGELGSQPWEAAPGCRVDQEGGALFLVILPDGGTRVGEFQTDSTDKSLARIAPRLVWPKEEVSQI